MGNLEEERGRYYLYAHHREVYDTRLNDETVTGNYPVRDE